MEKAIFYPFLMFIFAITMIGGWIPTIKLWSQETFRLVISFCAGILLGAVFFHVLPEISMISNDLDLAAGMCGAASGWVPTTVGQPTLKIDSILVGGR